MLCSKKGLKRYRLQEGYANMSTNWTSLSSRLIMLVLATLAQTFESQCPSFRLQNCSSLRARSRVVASQQCIAVMNNGQTTPGATENVGLQDTSGLNSAFLLGILIRRSELEDKLLESSLGSDARSRASYRLVCREVPGTIPPSSFHDGRLLESLPSVSMEKVSMLVSRSGLRNSLQVPQCSETLR
jgi:hypothetical protein